MQVCVINNTEPKNVNIPLVTAAGGAAGLAVRHFAPVMQEEIDTVMFNQSDVIKRNNFESAKKSFTNNLQKLYKKNPDDKALELVIQRLEAKTLEQAKAAKDKIKNAPENIKSNINKIKNEMVVQIKASRNLTEANLKNAAKQARSVWAYLLPGAALAALGAYVYNVIGTIRED